MQYTNSIFEVFHSQEFRSGILPFKQPSNCEGSVHATSWVKNGELYECPIDGSIRKEGG